MKKLNFLGTLMISVALLASTGCHHKPVAPTPIPGSEEPNPNQGQNNQNPGTGEQVNPTTLPTATSQPTPEDYGNYAALFNGPHNEDADKFKDDTVYFDFDSSAIKPSEESKLQDIATYFKGNSKYEGLIIQGNCDERGTEKYNLSLGERRALAAREYLSNLGVDPQRIKTVTFGASKPVDPGHDESAWKKNRRDDFVLVTPKQ